MHEYTRCLKSNLQHNEAASNNTASTPTSAGIQPEMLSISDSRNDPPQISHDNLSSLNENILNIHV